MNEVSSLNLEPGNLVGGYTLLSRLGGGAMGSVWRVKDGGDNIYAMKILRDSLSDDTRSQDRQESDTARERLRREAAALRKVDHPGVCQIEDMELDDSLAFIVTELIDGQNLREDVARNGRYVADDLERLAAKLIDAVEAVHRAGIIHRDIKPTNVMVSRTGPVLVDFGIAMGAGESHVTRTGLVMGTPGFIAPEIIDGAESDETSDWWSLSAVLAFAATGRPVFGSKPMMAVLERAAAGHADLSGLPPRTTAALRSALDPDRRKRCTPQELLHAIELDAAEPRLWDMAAQTSVQQAASGADKEGTDDEAGQGRVVPPFGKRSSDNPRLLWRGAELMTPPPPPTATSADDGHGPRKRVVLAGQTRMVPLTDDAADSATELLTPPAPPARRTTDEREAAPSGETTVLDAAPTVATALPGTTAMPSAPAPMPASSATTVLPTATTTTADAHAETPQSPQERTPDPPPTPYAYVTDKRATADARGRLIIILLVIPLCLFAASLPAGGMISAMLLLWLFTTTGLSAEAQFRREGKRGGQRKGTDTALQIGSLPWHAAKGLAFSIVPSLLMLALSTALDAFLGAAASLQTVRTGGTVLGMAVRIPLIAGDALSASGLVLMLGMAAGWFVGTLGPYSRYARIGAGVIRDGGAGGAETEDDGYDDESASERWARLSRRLGQRGWTLLIVWGVLVLAGVAILLTGDPIDWSPIVLTF